MNTSPIIHDSLARPCRRCDVRDVIHLLPPPLYVTHRHNQRGAISEAPYPVQRVTSLMNNPPLAQTVTSEHPIP